MPIVFWSLFEDKSVSSRCLQIWLNYVFCVLRCGRANKNYRAETCLDVTVRISQITLLPFNSGNKITETFLFDSFSYQQIPDDHLAGCDIYPDADSPRRTELRPEGAGLPRGDFLLYLHVRATDKCRAEVRSA